MHFLASTMYNNVVYIIRIHYTRALHATAIIIVSQLSSVTYILYLLVLLYFVFRDTLMVLLRTHTHAHNTDRSVTASVSPAVSNSSIPPLRKSFHPSDGARCACADRPAGECRVAVGAGRGEHVRFRPPLHRVHTDATTTIIIIMIFHK